MFYNKIQAFGDSFTAGTELADGPFGHLTDDQEHSTHVWPALIAKSWNVDYCSNSLGGIGNQRISFSVIDRFYRSYSHNQNFYIINWTWFDRYDYLVTANDGWQTLQPTGNSKIEEYYFKNLHGEIPVLMQNLQIIHSTVEFLKSKRVDFIMTCLDSKIFSRDYHTGAASVVGQLQDMIFPYFLDFEGLTFLEWSHKHNFECGQFGHPLEQAHAAAAEYIEPYIRQKTSIR